MNNGSGMVFEGIGEEVVHLFILVALIIVPVIFFIKYNFFRHNTLIHSESEEVVAQVRNDLSQVGTEPRLNNDNLYNHAQMLNVPEHHYATVDELCPICLANISYPVETNCGHMFCANCIITYWNMGRWSGAIRCPTCRQQVTLLLRCFNTEGVNDQHLSQIIESIRRYNRLYSGEPATWLERIRDIPTLLRHMVSDIFSLSGLLLMFRLRILLCFILTILYLLSPLDLLPEAVFGLFGFIDDIIILVLGAIYTCLIYRHIVLAREAMGF